MTLEALEQEALKLNDAEREELAYRLFDSVEATDEDDARLFHVPRTEEEEAAEIERRIEEVRAGTDVGIPHEEVMARAREMLRESSPISPRRGS